MAWQTTMRRVFLFMVGSGESSRPQARRAADAPEGQAQRGAAAQPVREQVALAAQEPPLTQEDWFWGRNTAGTEEDFFWRRLSDNWYMKDVQPEIYLELHNECYEAYNANPLANTIVETVTNFTLGRGVIVSAANRRVQRVLDAFWRDPDNHMDSHLRSVYRTEHLWGAVYPLLRQSYRRQRKDWADRPQHD